MTMTSTISTNRNYPVKASRLKTFTTMSWNLAPSGSHSLTISDSCLLQKCPKSNTAPVYGAVLWYAHAIVNNVSVSHVLPSITQRLATELNIRPQQVDATVALLDEGATVALYRPLPERSHGGAGRQPVAYS